MVCGMCQHYHRRPDCEDFCDRTGKVVPYLAKRDCFEMKVGKTDIDENTNENKKTMSENINTKPQTKVCKICGRELPIGDFPAHPKAKDGHTATCKECHSKSMSDGLKAVKGKAPAEPKEMKPAEPRNCDRFKPIVFRKEGLAAYEDTELVKELRARGYEVECTKLIKL